MSIEKFVVMVPGRSIIEMVLQVRERQNLPGLTERVIRIVASFLKPQDSRHPDLVGTGDIFKVSISYINTLARREAGQIGRLVENIRVRFAQSKG